jgi:hypothetical protein
VQLPALTIPATGGRFEQVVSDPLGVIVLSVPELYEEVYEIDAVSAVTTFDEASSKATTGWFVMTDPEAPATGWGELPA